MNKGKARLAGVVAFVVIAVIAVIAWMVFTRATNVAIVNGERLSRNTFMARLEEKAGQDVLSELINERLIRQAARKANISITSEQVDREVAKLRKEIGPSFDSLLMQYGMTEQDLRESLEMNLLVFELSTKDIQVTEEEMKKYFEEHKADYDEPEQVKASHILVETEAEAKEIQKQLSGGADFAELAREKSIDPMSAIEGGDLGFFPRGRMTEAFEKVAFSLAPGQTSGIVHTEFGYHIIRVVDKTPARQATFDEVRDEIERSIKGQQAKSPQQLASELRLNGQITVLDPKYKSLGTTTPFGVK